MSRIFPAALIAFSLAVAAVPALAEQFASVEEMDALRTEVESLRRQLDQTMSRAGDHGGPGGGLDAGCCPAPCHCDCCCAYPGWRFSAEYLFWKLHSDNLHFAWTEDNLVGNFGEATLIDVQLDYEDGYRVRGAYQTACGWELAAVFTDYHTSGETTIVDVDGAGIAVIHDTRLPIDGTTYQQATGAYSFDLQIIDAEFAKVITLDCCTDLRLFGGFRFADIEQHLRAIYQIAPGVIDTFNEDVNARLYGIRVGSEGEWCFCRRLGLYGRLAGSILTGSVHHNYQATLAAGGNGETGPIHLFQGAIPVLEVAAGVKYHYCGWEIAAGYEASSWFGLSKSMRPMDDVDETRFSNEQFDIVLQGWTFRVGRMF
jgi:hypothetical protein